MTKWSILNELYLNKGLKIFPIKENGKTPLISKWQEDCSADLFQVLYYYENAKNCNWGLPATPNNLFVIDLDVHDENKNGVDNFKRLMEEIGLESIDTMTQITPSGGVHLIYQTNETLKNVPNCSNAFSDYPGIDIRTDGYIVVEPSSINDKEYKITNLIPPMPMPVLLQQYILENVGTKEERKKSQYTKPTEKIDIGNRDTALFEYITYLYYKTKLTYNEILILAKTFNNDFTKPLPEKTVVYKVDKAFEKNRGECLYIWLGEKE